MLALKRFKDVEEKGDDGGNDDDGKEEEENPAAFIAKLFPEAMSLGEFKCHLRDVITSNKIDYKSTKSMTEVLGNLLVKSFPEQNKRPIHMYKQNLFLNNSGIWKVASVSLNKIVSELSEMAREIVNFFFTEQNKARESDYGTKDFKTLEYRISEEFNEHLILSRVKQVITLPRNVLLPVPKKKYYSPAGISVNEFQAMSSEESERKIKEYFKNNPFDVTNSNRFDQLVEEETIKLLSDEVEVSEVIKAHATELVKVQLRKDMADARACGTAIKFASAAVKERMVNEEIEKLVDAGMNKDSDIIQELATQKSTNKVKSFLKSELFGMVLLGYPRYTNMDDIIDKSNFHPCRMNLEGVGPHYQLYTDSS